MLPNCLPIEQNKSLLKPSSSINSPKQDYKKNQNKNKALNKN